MAMGGYEYTPTLAHTHQLHPHILCTSTLAYCTNIVYSEPVGMFVCAVCVWVCVWGGGGGGG